MSTDSYRTAGRIVVGIDGSAQSHVAARWAARRAQTTGVGLTVLLVTPPLRVPGRGGSVFAAMRQGVDEFTRQVTEAARKNLAEAEAVVREEFGELDLETVMVDDSEPALELVRASEQAELVVVGTRGLGAARAMAMGSVSAHLVAQARGPVVVVPETGIAEDDRARGTVVVGIEDATQSTETLRAALAEARRIDGTLLAIHTWEYDPALSAGLPALDTSMYQPMTKAFDEDLREMVAREVSRTGDDVAVETRVSVGRPGEVLVHASHEAELVVVGSRGANGLAGVLLGSTARQVVRQSICPVMVLPHRKH
ncbi:universal stress protein [Luteococcus peritonei]|uniref:Universal stress protein n=1 Tax=Luteococcus peritonei TaxID=88874 RepID=A0ABW4RUK3_9ACTN